MFYEGQAVQSDQVVGNDKVEQYERNRGNLIFSSFRTKFFKGYKT